MIRGGGEREGERGGGEIVRCGREYFAQKCSENLIMVSPQSATTSLLVHGPTKVTMCVHLLQVYVSQREYLCAFEVYQ